MLPKNTLTEGCLRVSGKSLPPHAVIMNLIIEMCQVNPIKLPMLFCVCEKRRKKEAPARWEGTNRSRGRLSSVYFMLNVC